MNIICRKIIPHDNGTKVLDERRFPTLLISKSSLQQKSLIFVFSRLAIICLNSHYSMMASSNGNIFRVTGHLCPRWIPRTKASDADLWCFHLRLNIRLSKQSWSWWFETLSCPLWRHRNGVLEKVVIFILLCSCSLNKWWHQCVTVRLCHRLMFNTCMGNDLSPSGDNLTLVGRFCWQILSSALEIKVSVVKLGFLIDILAHRYSY